MVDGLGPWCGDFDEDVVLECFLGLMMDLPVGPKDGEIEVVRCRVIVIGGWMSRIVARKDLVVYLVADFSRQF